MSLNIKFGNMLSVESGLIIHGCNTHGVMGSGIALQVKERWPECFSIYSSFCKENPNKDSLLGQVIPYAVPDTSLIIANAITQKDFGNDRNKKYVSYEAIAKTFSIIAEAAHFTKVPIHYPLIGAGLGGGDWAIISDIIECVFMSWPLVERTLWIYE